MLTPAARRALELRRELSKTSVSKLDTILATASPDGRLRNGYKYYGGHTGRWSAGSGESPTAQLQNLPRGTVKDIDAAAAAILVGAPLDAFGSPLDVISSCLRSCFRAPASYHFTVADLAQIEVRVLAWLAGCRSILNVYAHNGDLYTDFAQAMYKSATIDKGQRQIAKSAVLGCGYGMGAGREALDKHGDAYKSGLWGYAESMGVSMTQTEAEAAVRAYRAQYAEIPQYWLALERAAVEAVLYPGRTVELAPLRLGCVGKKLLWIELPAGRRLHYLRPVVENGELSFEGKNLGQWGRRKTWGGHLTENVVQAVARDVLAEGLLRADAAGFEIVGHSHDEIITLVPDGSPLGLPQLIAAMTAPISWADGLPLAAEGWEGECYRK